MDIDTKLKIGGLAKGKSSRKVLIPVSVRKVFFVLWLHVNAVKFKLPP